jgi:hypothetical protein
MKALHMHELAQVEKAVYEDAASLIAANEAADGRWLGLCLAARAVVRLLEDFAPPGHCLAVPVAPAVLYRFQDRLHRHVAGAPAWLEFGDVDGGTGVDLAAYDAQLHRYPVRCQRLLQCGPRLAERGCNEVSYSSEQSEYRANHRYLPPAMVLWRRWSAIDKRVSKGRTPSTPE